MLISLLISLLIFALIFGLVYWILGMIPLPNPVKQIIYAILGVIAVIYLVGMLSGAVTAPHYLAVR